MKYSHQRVFAFIIDIMLVSFLTMCISEVSYMNPYLYDYQSAYEKYNKVYLESYDLAIEDDAFEFIDKITPPLYNLEQKSIFVSLWYLLFYYLYFGVFAYYTGGQTLGKKLLKLKVVMQNGDNVSFIRLSLRCLINGSSLFFGVNICVLLNLLILLIGPNIMYFSIYTLISLLALIIELGMIITLLFNKNNRTLNDIIFKTKVISLK